MFPTPRNKKRQTRERKEERQNYIRNLIRRVPSEKDKGKAPEAPDPLPPLVPALPPPPPFLLDSVFSSSPSFPVVSSDGPSELPGRYSLSPHRETLYELR